jgi:hypothetical protein
MSINCINSYIISRYNEYTNKGLDWIVVIQRPIHYVHQRVKVVRDEKIKNVSGSDNLVTNPSFGSTDAEDLALSY